MKVTPEHNARIAKMTFATVYPLYMTKVERKGRTREELNQVIEWLTGFDEKKLQELIVEKATDQLGVTIDDLLWRDRVAVHEYLVTATVDPAAMTVLALCADPRVLPYRECPAAVANITRMIGQPVSLLRGSVLETLPGALGCTHLNDVLRSLSDLAELVEHLA